MRKYHQWSKINEKKKNCIRNASTLWNFTKENVQQVKWLRRLFRSVPSGTSLHHFINEKKVTTILHMIHIQSTNILSVDFPITMTISAEVRSKTYLTMPLFELFDVGGLLLLTAVAARGHNLGDVLREPPEDWAITRCCPDDVGGVGIATKYIHIRYILM